MKILLINYEYPPIGGGAGNATFFLARELFRLGHAPVVVTAAFEDLPSHSVEEGIEIHRLPARRKSAAASNPFEMVSFAWVARRQIIAIAQSAGIEAVIVFFTFPCGPIARKLNKELKLPYVVSLRGGDVPGLVPNLNLYHCVLRFWRQKVLGNATAIVANDHGLARLAEAADHFPVHVVPNGVDCEYFTPPALKQSGLRDRPFRWLFSGRLHVQKNLFLLFSSFSELLKIHPQAGEIVLVGDGPIAAELKAHGERLGIADRIKWLGWVDKEKVRTAYQSADAIVNPSQYEGMPNVVLEAMACGRPVIASDIPGNNTLVLHEQTGLLFPLGEPSALRITMNRLLLDSTLVERLGAAARHRVQSEYSWRNVAERYLELFKPGM